MQSQRFFQGGPVMSYGRQQPRRAGGAPATVNLKKQAIIGLILVVALLAFEIFNFDTTRFALRDLMGGVSFFGIQWAAILAIAFCAIDFAGLAHLLTPRRQAGEGRDTWYLMGAWLLGATMNAMMTWWAVTVTLLSHDLGNEVMTRQQLIQAAPIFVAVLVWLTRILFIGAFSVAGDHFFHSALVGERPTVAVRPAAAEPRVKSQPAHPGAPARPGSHRIPHVSDEAPAFLNRRTAGRVIEPLDDDEAEPLERARPLPTLGAQLKLGEELPIQPVARARNERVTHRPPSPGPVRSVPLGAAPRNRR
jgi:hypothetical protein